MPNELLVERSEGIATLTMNRPEVRNALSQRLADALARAFEEVARDPEVRVVVLTGSGGSFCAGLDLKEFAQLEREPDEVAWTRPVYWDPIEAFPGPIIAAVDGPAITAGFEIALACDVIVASTRARFADTHARVGIVPGAGLSQRLSRAVGIYRAKYLSLTGNFLTGEQAAAWGLASHVVEPERLAECARSVARDMLSAPPGMLARVKRLIADGFGTTLAEGLQLEAEASAGQFATERPQEAAGSHFAEVRSRGRAQLRRPPG